MDIENIKVGEGSPDSIMFDKPAIEHVGNELWSYWKYANDAGGYFVHGLVLMPFGPWGIYTWPWDLGIPNGGLKDDNNGAHYWGYVNDGIGKNITSGINKNFPANVNGNYGYAIAVYGDSPNYTGEDGTKYLDFGDHPIVVHFLDGRFDDVNWVIPATSVVDISADKRTITIHRVKHAYNVSFIAVSGYNDNSIETCRVKLTDVYADVTGLSYHKQIFTQCDPSSVECHDAYLGEEQIWHKDKTIDNCWRKYGMSDDVTVDGLNFISVNRDGVSDEVQHVVIPETIDYKEHILPMHDSGITPLQFNTSLEYSPALLQGIKDWLMEHPVTQIIDEHYNEITSNLKYANRMFRTGGNLGDLTLKFAGNEPFLYLPYMFKSNIIDKLTLIVIGDKIHVGSAQFLFKNATIREIEVLGEDGNKNDNFILAHDLSGMCEFNGGLREFPNIVDWRNRSPQNSKGVTYIQYAFSYCKNLQVIAQGGSERESDYNTIIAGMCQQAFQQCSNLVTIGPVLDLRYIDFSENFVADAPGYEMFQGCTSLTDVRIKNLNGSYVNFNDKGKHGILPSLDAESVAYLFENLTDLTTYNALTANETANNSWYCYKKNGDLVSNSEIGISTLSCKKRVPAGSDAYMVINDGSNTYYKHAIDTDISVQGLMDTDVLVWKVGNVEHVLTNGMNHISKGLEETGMLILRNSGVSETTEFADNPVTLTMQMVYEPGALAGSGELHCPAQWEDKITDEMVNAANAKGWSIYINEVLKTV